MKTYLNTKNYTLKELIIFMIVVIIGTISYSHVFESKSDSFESHLVYNYISEYTPNLIPQFEEINGNWPPSRQKMATLLLDAQRQVQLVERTKN